MIQNTPWGMGSQGGICLPKGAHVFGKSCSFAFVLLHSGKRCQKQQQEEVKRRPFEDRANSPQARNHANSSRNGLHSKAF
jgi:hypothetical protein